MAAAPSAAEPSLDALVEALRRLPGVGQKSAQRMAFHLLQHDRDGALRLAAALQGAVARVGHCRRCHTFTEGLLCHVCADPSRDARQLCVVETPADQAALERSASYRGLYFVLMGRISPLDGIGPQDIGAAALLARVDGQDAEGGQDVDAAAPQGSDATGGAPRSAAPAVEEVILATSFTAAGELTAQALAEALKARGLKVTRLARGVPAGSEIEYVDLSTIAHALADRR